MMYEADIWNIKIKECRHNNNMRFILLTLVESPLQSCVVRVLTIQCLMFQYSVRVESLRDCGR